jgi:hypothetical protein
VKIEITFVRISFGSGEVTVLKGIPGMVVCALRILPSSASREISNQKRQRDER